MEYPDAPCADATGPDGAAIKKRRRAERQAASNVGGLELQLRLGCFFFVLFAGPEIDPATNAALILELGKVEVFVQCGG